MSAQVHPHITPDQYLELDESSLETRHEYYNGRMYAMASGGFNHGLIVGNLLTELNNSLKDRSQWRVVPNDLRILVEQNGLYTYPDIVVVCGEPQFSGGGGETLLNPVLLAEVLSPSTEAYDRGFKAAQYRRLKSLREYMIVSQDEPRVELMRREDDGQWRISDFAGMDAICHLASVDSDLVLAEIYRGVVLAAAGRDAAHPSAGV